MAKIITIKCPECGGVLEVHEGSPFYFCNYCGTKVFVDDGNKTETYRKVDEARIKEAETARTVRLREIELEERKLKLTEKIKMMKLVTFLVVAGIGAGFTWLAEADYQWHDLSNPGQLLLFALPIVGVFLWISEGKHKK
mgnify:CR=1 FL=1